MRALSLLVLLACLLPGPGCARGSAASGTPAQPLSTRRVQASLLNLLACPSLNCDVVEDLRQGQEVGLLSPDLHGWVQVRVPASGHEGYVQSRFLAP